MYHGGVLWTCIGLRPGDRVPWRCSVDMHWVETGDRVPWRYSVDMHWVEAGGPCTMAVFCGHALG